MRKLAFLLIVLVGTSAVPAGAQQEADTPGRYRGTATFETLTVPGAPNWGNPEDQGPMDALLRASCDESACTVTSILPYGDWSFVLEDVLPLTVPNGGSVEVPRSSDGCGGIDLPSSTISVSSDGDSVSLEVVIPPYEVRQGNCYAWDWGGTFTFEGEAAASSVPGAAGGEQGAAGGQGQPGDQGSTVDDGATGAVERPLADRLTERQRESLAALERRDRSSVPASLATPSEAATGTSRTLVNLLLSALVVLLIVFPSELFNSTWSDHHDRVEAWIGRRLGIRLGTDRPQPENRSRLGLYAGCVVAGAVLAGFLDPGFGLDAASAGLVGGAVVSITISGLILGAAALVYRARRRLSTVRYVDAVPAGLVVAAVCVVISRAVGFQPGYLYGLVGGMVFVASLERDDEGRSELVATIVAATVAIVAWILAGPVGDAANNGDPGFALQVADAALASLFVGGIEGLMIGLAPLEFLPGHNIWTWKKPVWVATAFAVVFLFFQVLLRPESGYLGASTTSSTLVTVALFVGFGLASVAFWGWFRLRPDPPGGGVETTPETEQPAALSVSETPDTEQPEALSSSDEGSPV